MGGGSKEGCHNPLPLIMYPAHHFKDKIPHSTGGDFLGEGWRGEFGEGTLGFRV